MGAEKLEVASEGGHERKFEVALTVVCGFAETKEELDVPNPVIDVGGAGDAFTEAEIEWDFGPDSSSASSITAVDSTRKYGALSELSIEDSFFSGKEDTETASWRASDDEGILPFRFLKESPEALSSLHFYGSNVQVRLKEEEEESRSRKQQQQKKKKKKKKKEMGKRKEEKEKEKER